jgi:ABC-type Na+ efflux pump permease subunit
METLKPAKIDKELSPKQLAYANHVLSGKTQANAYILAYEKPADYNLQNARSAGQKLFNSKTIQSYIRTQTKKAEKKAGLSLAERFQILADIAIDENNSPDTRIRCIDVYNKMTGDNKQNITMEGSFSNNSFKQMTVKDKINALREAREIRKSRETVEDKREPANFDKTSDIEKREKKGEPPSAIHPSDGEGNESKHLPLVEIESYKYE